MTQKNKTVLITGASSGIGYEMTPYFARDGYNLVLVARSEEPLRKLAKNMEQQFGVQAFVLVKDLAQPSAPEEVYRELTEAGISVDVLINNAGYGTFGLFTDTPLDKELQMLQLNIVALTHLTKLFARDMLKKGSGKILNVASTAAFQPGPLMAAYYASKAYVLSFTEALANEFEGTGVTISALCPGPTESGFQKAAAMEKSKLVQNKIMDTDTVARIGYDSLLRNQTVVITGFMNKAMVFAVRFMPRKLVTKLVRAASNPVR